MRHPGNESLRSGGSQRGEQLIKEGRRRFLSEFQKYIRELECLLETCSTGDEGSRVKLRTIAHTMKGSAPVFGLNRIGEISARLLDLWEEDSASLTDKTKVRTLLQPSRQLLSELHMEYEIYRKELELEGADSRRSQGVLATQSRLLIIDDDPVLRSYLLRSLQYDGYEVMEASDVESGKRLLRQHHFDLIILDLMMYPQSGYELFDFLKEDPTFKWLPLIVLSGRGDLQDKVQCFFLGADDYVTKPFQYEELAARIYSLLHRNKGFEQMAFRDPLTGVFNRRYMDQQLQRELQRIERYPTPITMAFIDIDRFKSINDTFGHSAGDVVLQGLANVLQNRMRVTDLIARFGGEEFVVVMPNTTAEEGERVLGEALQVVRETAVARDEVREYRITFSAGVAQWREGLTAEQWIRLADTAMYNSKANGRNRITRIYQDEKQLPLKEEQRKLKKLLVADDDEIIRSFIVNTLNHLPIEIIQAVDGRDALDKLRTEEVDLCILDGMMPRMDGLTLLHELRRDKSLAGHQAKVIMLTARKKEEDMQQGLLLGAEEYMAKPFSIVELEIRVKRLLDITDQA
ncbi:response regulator [Paenibacillus sp. GCM10012307]|uniref:Response regulator n=1 Tax=Paenibacillus roseus TaxID=2798579 RepID=A0A934JBE5_9BACL|nr:response regulator [Paenibacillus roseus]MBJ6364056.1 response regulator [Paenibacillus roseus]